MSFRLEIATPKKTWVSCEEIQGFPTAKEIEDGVNEIAFEDHSWRGGSYRIVDEQSGAVVKEFALAPPPADCNCHRPCEETTIAI
jgi:hypothetical protein